MKNTLRITFKIENDMSELGEDTYYLTFDEMYARFGDSEELSRLISRAQQFAKAEGLDESELYESKEEAEFNKEDII